MIQKIIIEISKWIWHLFSLFAVNARGRYLQTVSPSERPSQGFNIKYDEHKQMHYIIVRCSWTLNLSGIVRGVDTHESSLQQT